MKTPGETPPSGETRKQLTEIMRSLEHLERNMTPLWHAFKYSYEPMVRIEQRHPREEVTQAPRLLKEAAAQASHLIRFAGAEILQPRPGVAQIKFLPSTFRRLREELNFDEMHWISYGGKRGTYRLEVLRVQLNSQYQEESRPPPLLKATQFTIRGYDADNPNSEETLDIINGRPYTPVWYEDAASVFPRKEYYQAETLPARIATFWTISRRLDEQEWPALP